MDLLARSSDGCNCIPKHFETATYVFALLLFIAIIAIAALGGHAYHVCRRIKNGDPEPLKSCEHFERKVQGYGRYGQQPPMRVAT